ncbi:hypothetical protein QOZ80_8BG0662360 [Eleusine coracana subsp. coracana]|nr:hypothetical protein QOZ80_8BG0662360 [Eleusine coracana subsp. coracana]
MACGSFADLPGDIVRIVADRAAVECRPRMRAVCSAWSAAVPVEPQPPWILLQPDDDTEGEGFTVLSLPAKSGKLSPVTSPVVRCLNAFLAAPRCVGAGHGWLALVGADLSVTLVNPISTEPGRAVSLPPLTRHPMAAAGVREDGRVTWSGKFGTWSYPGKHVSTGEFRDMVVRKVVFAARPRQDGYFAVAVSAGCPGSCVYAMYARTGSAAWETLRDAHGRAVSLVHDVVHVDGGRFLDVMRCHGRVMEVDLAADSPTFSLFAGPLASAESGAVSFFGSADMNVENHLALVEGVLYQVWVSWAGDRVPEEQDAAKEFNRYRIEDAGVLRCDPELPTSWSEAADLGDWAVFIGRNETVAVRATDVPWVTSSCLYFIDSRLEGVICAFDLRSGQQVPVEVETTASCAMARSNKLRLSTAPPVWFLPSLK